MSISEKITFTLGEIIENIRDGWITITGGLNVTNNLEVNGSVTFYGGDFSVNTSDLFVDVSTGRVGIGTINPTSELDVIGAINATDWTNVTITESQITDFSANTTSNMRTAIQGQGYYNESRINITVLQNQSGTLGIVYSYFRDAFIEGNTTEEIQDSAWDVTGGTQTLITVTYQDNTDDVDFVVTDTLSSYTNDANFAINGSDANFAIVNITNHLVLGWKNLTDYPNACTSSQTATTYGDTISCTSISITESQVSDFSANTTSDIRTAIQGQGYYNESRINTTVLQNQSGSLGIVYSYFRDAFIEGNTTEEIRIAANGFINSTSWNRSG